MNLLEECVAHRNHYINPVAADAVKNFNSSQSSCRDKQIS